MRCRHRRRISRTNKHDEVYESQMDNTVAAVCIGLIRRSARKSRQHRIVDIFPRNAALFIRLEGSASNGCRPRCPNRKTSRWYSGLILKNELIWKMWVVGKACWHLVPAESAVCAAVSLPPSTNTVARLCIQTWKNDVPFGGRIGMERR